MANRRKKECILFRFGCGGGSGSRSFREALDAVNDILDYALAIICAVGENFEMDQSAL